MTASLDLIITPRPERVGTQAPKSDRTSGEPADRFADHLPQGPVRDETPVADKKKVVSHNRDESSELERTSGHDHKVSDINISLEDAAPIKPDAAMQTKSQQSDPEQVMANLIAKITVTALAPPDAQPGASLTAPAQPARIDANPALDLAIGEASVANSQESTIAPSGISQSTQPHDQHLNTALIKSNKVDEPAVQIGAKHVAKNEVKSGDDVDSKLSAQAAIIPEKQTVETSSAPVVVRNHTVEAHVEQTPSGVPSLANNNVQPTPAIADTEFTQKPDAPTQNTVAKEAGHSTTPLPAIQPTPLLPTEDIKTDGVTVKTQNPLVQINSSQPRLLDGAPQNKSTPIETGKPAAPLPDQILTPLEDTLDSETIRRASLAKNDDTLSGKPAQTENQKGHVQTHPTSTQTSDKPTLNAAQTDVPNTQSTHSRTPLASQPYLHGALLEQQTPTENQPGSSLTIGASFPGERSLTLDQTQPIRLTANESGAALPVRNIAIQMAKNLKSGVNRFEIRIDPPEMGRIHVRMEMTHDGRVQAILSAERSDTLDLLQRDAKLLGQSLDEAGLDVDSDSLQFSLRDDSDQPTFNRPNNDKYRTFGQATQSETADRLEAIATQGMVETYGFKITSVSGINIQI